MADSGDSQRMFCVLPPNDDGARYGRHCRLFVHMQWASQRHQLCKQGQGQGDGRGDSRGEATVGREAKATTG